MLHVRKEIEYCFCSWLRRSSRGLRQPASPLHRLALPCLRLPQNPTYPYHSSCSLWRTAICHYCPVCFVRLCTAIQCVHYHLQSRKTRNQDCLFVIAPVAQSAQWFVAYAVAAKVCRQWYHFLVAQCFLQPWFGQKLCVQG